MGAGMSYQYKITIEAWPHSTGRGQAQDQKDAGPHTQEYTVGADSMRHACGIADQLARAVERNPMVWQAPIRSIVWMFR